MNASTIRSLAIRFSMLSVIVFGSTKIALSQGPGSSPAGVVGFNLTFDETGAALLNGNPTLGTPIPGGGVNFVLPSPVLPGFVLINTPIDANTANPNGDSDLLIFSNTTLATGQTVGVLTYESLVDPFDPLLAADVPRLQYPVPVATITEIGPEGNNGFKWVPDPGNLAGSVYIGISDGFVTPEPSTFVLSALGIVCCAAMALRRRLAKNR